ncbi:MAG: DUF2199 domain-containing protein [Planctomycetota bacterium]
MGWFKKAAKTPNQSNRCDHASGDALCFAADAPWREILGVPHDAKIEDYSGGGGRVDMTGDMCVVDGKHFFVRGHIELRILDTQDVFAWSVWCSLSHESFEIVSDRWTTIGRENDPPRFGWLQTDLPGYPGGTRHLKTMVHQREVGVVPWIEVEPGSQLAEEQAKGIMIERWRELIRAAKG